MNIIDKRARHSITFREAKQGDIFEYQNGILLMTDDADMAVELKSGEIWEIDHDATIFPIENVSLVIGKGDE